MILCLSLRGEACNVMLLIWLIYIMQLVLVLFECYSNLGVTLRPLFSYDELSLHKQTLLRQS